MGSRNSQTTTYWVKDNIQVVCGCWKLNLDDFEKRVQEVHGDDEHGKQYKKYIETVKRIIGAERDGLKAEE